MKTETLVVGDDVSLRKIETSDFSRISQFEFSVSITEPHSSTERLAEIHAETGMWRDDSGAVAIVENATGRMIGTSQFYRAAPCIHGFELGYVIHDPEDRGRGYAARAVRLFSDYLFLTKPSVFRQQLVIEVWNTASWKVAERCGFVREGLLRSCGFGEGDPADCFIYSRTRKDYG